MREDQIPRFNKYFSEKDPELFNLFSPHLNFIADAESDFHVANMTGKQHFTEDQGNRFRQIVLDFDGISEH